MSKSNKGQESIKANYALLFKSFFLGALLAEIILCIKVLFRSFEQNFIENQKDGLFWLIVSFYIISIFISIYFARAELNRRFKIVVQSKKIDILIVFVSGIILMFVLGGIGINFFGMIAGYLSCLHTFLLLIIPIIFLGAILIGKINLHPKKHDNQISSFISDKEGISRVDDAFGFFEISKRFSERVYNQGASESLVFGVDAPWGTGKSTFMNLCKENWNENYGDKIVIYTFDPLRFENNDNILEKFVDGLLKIIKLNFFAPELESLMSKYIKLLNDAKMTFSVFGVRFGIPFDNSSIDITFEKLERTLKNIDKKIVIIVDDLDRLNFSSIKEILFVIKKSFILPNISYVLCYDTENITALEQQKLDTEKIIEFLEKFINIKTSLYLDHDLLLNYFTDYKNEVLARNLLSNTDLVAKAVEGLKDIFQSKEYHLYMPFIGDARKLKRLVNTIILLEVEKVDFSNLDFDKHDLIHLLIIYINYPSIFRKIYNTESNGKREFFSVIYDDKKYKNSKDYIQYLTTLTDNQKFVLNKIFDAEQRLGSERNISEEQQSSYACFNGTLFNPNERNLEQYLSLITKFSQPPQTEQYKFYINKKDKILKEENNIIEVMTNNDFSLSQGEKNHDQIWRVLVNAPHNEFTSSKAHEVILYAIDSLPRYSIIEDNNINIGLRNFTLPFFIVKLLDKVGWVDGNGKHWNNSDENVIGIAQWIFGEGTYENCGVIEKLSHEEKGILGINDLLKFRLYCCSDRGGDVFNLSRSLLKHADPSNPTSGDVEKIVIEEMREISQRIFQIFNVRYIDKKINIFKEVLGLSSKAICGDSYYYIKDQLNDGTLDAKIQEVKSRILSFIIYQLGNTIYAHGIPCGYYDVDNNTDAQGISRMINDYLFNVCFNPKLNDKGYDYFLYYLFLNYENFNPFEYSNKRIATRQGFLKVLLQDQLIDYWKQNNKSIKNLDYNWTSKIYEGEYTTIYSNDVQETFKVLDELLDDPNINIEPVSL